MSRIDFRGALGLELTEPCFDFSVLCEVLTHQIAGSADPLLLAAVLHACKARCLVKARSKQRGD